MMDSFHSCRVEKRENGKVFLASISGKYFFWMNESVDDHWEVIKQIDGDVLMFLLSLLFATHVPQDLYFKCDDFDWLKERALRSELLSVSKKIEIISNWMHHTDPKCFEDKK